MQTALLPHDESARLSALYQYHILDSEPEVAFDEMTTLAANICGTSMAYIGFLDVHRQWFKSTVGIPAREIARNLAFCNYTILETGVLVVPDTLADQRFANNPLVIDEPRVRFYAGVPLITSEGHALGAICVVDRTPHELSPSQIEALQALGRLVVTQLELRRKLEETQQLEHTAQLQESALREREERFRAMADSAPVLMWMSNADQQYTFYNQTWLQFTGRSLAQELTGWQQNLHPGDRQTWMRSYTSAFREQRAYTTEYRLKRADGIYRWMLETGVPRFTPDHTFAGFIGSCVDITERKATEQDIQLLQTVTHAIVTSPDFHSALQIALQKVCEATQWDFGEAWVPSADKTVMECSSAWYSKTDRLAEFRQQSEAFTFSAGVGIPGRVWASKKTEWHQNISLESDKTYLRAQLAMAAGLKATLGLPLLANDEVITVLVFYMFEARPEDHRLIDLIAASTELGLFIQRKQAEEEIRKSLAKEQELNRFKSNFLANVSHELRTPLTSVLGLSEVLLQQHFGSINRQQEQYLSLIHSSGEHLLRLINDLLDLAKIEAGKQELNKTVVDITELCQNAIEMVKGRSLVQQQQVSLELPVAIESIVADQQRITQILLNFLSNALKFTPEEGTITLKTRLASQSEMEAQTLPVGTPEEALFGYRPESFLVIEVSDTGIGIASDKQHLLFHAFQQIHDTSDHQYQGSGLGLALSKQLAELHGGRVSFSSTLGAGSCFAVWLPLTEN